MKTRRAVLRGLAAVLAPIPRPLFLGVPLALSPISPAAAWVMVALAVVQTAISVAKMFGPKGPSVGDLLSLQTEMLRNLSQQINVLNQQISLIFERLDELKNMIEALPHENTIHLYRTRLSAQLAQSRQLMLIYADEKSSRGIERATEVVAKRLEEEVLRTIREATNAFAQERNEALIPLMASAMQAEIVCMLMVGSKVYPDSAIRVVLKQYESWFSAWFNPDFAKNLPGQCRKLVADMMAQKTQSDDLFRKYNGWVCYRNLVHINPPWGPMRYDRVSLEITGEEIREFDNAVTSLRDDGAVLPELLGRIAAREAKVVSDHFPERDYGETQREIRQWSQKQTNSAYCKDEPKVPETVRDEYRQLSNDFDLKAPKLLGLFSFLVIASNSRGACEKFYSALGTR